MGLNSAVLADRSSRHRPSYPVTGPVGDAVPLAVPFETVHTKAWGARAPLPSFAGSGPEERRRARSRRVGQRPAAGGVLAAWRGRGRGGAGQAGLRAGVSQGD